MTTASMTSRLDVCEYCGRKLEPFSFEVLGRTVTFIESCDCDGAKEARGERPKETDFERRERMYEAAGISSQYATANVPCSEYVNAVKSGRNVYVYGPNGSGKSWLAASIAKKLLDGGAGVLFVNACHAVRLLQRQMDGESTDVYERMCDAPVLVIDDLGKGNPTEWDASVWYSVAEARYSGALPTIVTTNYSGGELVARLTAKSDDSTARAIVSRLRGGAVVAKLDGRDRRLA